MDDRDGSSLAVLGIFIFLAADTSVSPEPVYGEPSHSLLSPIVPNFGCSSTRVPLGAIAMSAK